MFKIARFASKDYAESGFSLISTLRSVMIAIIVSIVLLFAFALMVTYTPFPEGMIDSGVVIVLIISNALAGWRTARITRSNGWLNGTIAGGIYMLVIFLAGMMVNGFSFSMSTVIMIITGIVSGAVGGIFGINSKSNKR